MGDESPSFRPPPISRFLVWSIESCDSIDMKCLPTYTPKDGHGVAHAHDVDEEQGGGEGAAREQSCGFLGVGGLWWVGHYETFFDG